MKDKTLYIMCGIPGSGKTYMAKHFLMRGSGWRYISRDEIRLDFLGDDEEYFAHEDEVFDIFIYKIREALNNADTFNVIADATHLNWASRRKLLANISEEGINLHNIYIVPVMINCPFEIAGARNAARQGRACVPENTLEKMYYRMTDPNSDPFIYDGILYLNNDVESWVSSM